MSTIRLVVVALALAGTANADPPVPAVNLLTAVPTVVAVSSTVANPKIQPAHLVDGSLETAWNSRTGEASSGHGSPSGSPPTCRSTRIKLTVGFTKVDKKWGDLFTMNPRIKRVRVTHSGTATDKVLDPELRTLQSIAIGKGGGDYTIEVLEVVPGTRKDWQEVNVSEPRGLGRAPSKSRVAKATPVVHIGGFDHDDLTRAQCLAALFDKPRGITVTSFETFDLDGERAVCRIDQPDEPSQDGSPAERAETITTRVTVGIVKRGAKLVRIAKLPEFAAHATRGTSSTACRWA